MIFLFLHFALVTILATLLSWVNGHLNSVVAITSLTVGTALAYVLRNSIKWEPTPEMAGRDRSWVDKVVLGLAFVYLFWNSFQIFFVRDNGWWTLNPHNYGDLPWHITIIRHLASGAHFWPSNPIFANDLIRYPFAIDLYNAVWEAAGTPLFQHLGFTHFVAMAVVLLLIYRWLGWVGVSGIFFAGGFYGWTVLMGQGIDIWMKDIAWKSAYLAMWNTQRSFLLGLPLGLIFIRHAIDEGAVFQRNAKGHALRVLLWGFFPFFHSHSFVAVGLMVFCIRLMRGSIKRQLLIWLAAAPIAGVFLYLLTDGFRRGSVAHFNWSGWQLEGKNPITFWIWNMGPWAVLWVVGVALAVWKPKLVSEREYRPRLLILSFSLFVLFNFLILAPWEWDNLKIMIWPYILFVVIAASVLQPLFTSDKDWVNSVEILLATALTFGGASIIGAIRSPQAVRLYELRETNEVTSCLSGIDPNAVFLTQMTFNHPVSFAGYKLAFGYAGHVWSHGIKDDGTEQKIRNIFRGSESWRSDLKDLHVTHIYWGQRELMEYSDGVRPWMTEFKEIKCRKFDQTGASVYVVQ